jgi:hypothetical protein
MKTQQKRSQTATALMATVALFVFSAAASAQYSDSRDGYFRTVEGQAWVTPATSTSPLEVEPNLPVLSGDRLEVQPGGRIEVVLPDSTIVRLESATEVTFESLAQSVETGETSTTILLVQGELQILIPQESSTRDYPRIDSINASMFIQKDGLYKITADDRSWTDVVVRQGYVEIATQRGSSFVRKGERASIEGAEWPRVSVEPATYLSSLELWGEELDSAARLASDGRLDPSLAYSGTALAYKGRWVETSGRRAWRPYVSVDWRPYTTGRWHSTRAGLYWVSNEPWGWLTHHYGSWSYSPGYGWLWYPGTVYSPAWVYWYWGSSHVAWSPIGIYTDFYRSRYGRIGLGYHHGIYGWAGGSFSFFSDWVFCDLRYFGRRNYSGYLTSGSRLARDTRHGSIGRGIITTDTREITPELMRRPTEIVAALGRNRRTRQGQTSGSGELTDVTSFIARQRELSGDVAEAVRGDRNGSRLTDRSRVRPGVSPADAAQSRTRDLVSRSSRSPVPSARPVRPGDPRQSSSADRARQSLADRENRGRSGSAGVVIERGGTGPPPRSSRNTTDWRRPTTRQLPDRTDRSDRREASDPADRVRWSAGRGDATSRSSNGAYGSTTRRPAAPNTSRRNPGLSSRPSQGPSLTRPSGATGSPRTSTPPVRRILDGVRSNAPSARPTAPAPSRPTASVPSRKPAQSRASSAPRRAPRSSGSTSKSRSSSGGSKASGSKSSQSRSRSSRSRSNR